MIAMGTVGEVIIDREGPCIDLIMMHLTEAASIADANGISLVSAFTFKKTATDQPGVSLYCQNSVVTLAEDLTPESFDLFAKTFARNDEKGVKGV